MMLGDPLTAESAERLGIVNRVVPRDDLAATVAALAQTVAAQPPLAIAAIKRFLLEADEASQGVKLNLERAVLGSLFATEDAREGFAAFREKRAPQFTGS
jgi:enoyl-CoA hydratase/carnithine racemase